MNITFNLDANCEICKRGLAKIKKLEARHEDAYGSRSRATNKLVGKIEIIPDYNSNGILTHWHVR